MDWGLGHYEHLAAQLRPAAEIVVDHLAPGPNEVVLDLGCGTGSAAMIAAGRGARVTGVDPAPQLLETARATAAAARLEADFILGNAADPSWSACSRLPRLSLSGSRSPRPGRP